MCTCWCTMARELRRNDIRVCVVCWAVCQPSFPQEGETPEAFAEFHTSTQGWPRPHGNGCGSGPHQRPPEVAQVQRLPQQNNPGRMPTVADSASTDAPLPMRKRHACHASGPDLIPTVAALASAGASLRVPHCHACHAVMPKIVPQRLRARYPDTPP